MVRFLELAYEAVAETVGELSIWLGGVFDGGFLDVRDWQPLTWVIVVAAVLLLLGLLSRRRPARSADVPELMVSHGLIGFEENGEGSFEADELAIAGLAAPARAHHQLSLTLSNLNAYPLQLLELAVRTRGARLPVVAEAGSVVPPHGAVDVTAELFDLPGDAGVIDLYLYSSGNKRRIWRLSAPLEWEPWTRAFRVKALAARVTPVARLASQERRRHERRAFLGARRRQRQRELTEGAYRRAESVKEQLAQRRVEAAQRAARREAEQRAALQVAAEKAAAEKAAAEKVAADQEAERRTVAQQAAAQREEVLETAVASSTPGRIAGRRPGSDGGNGRLRPPSDAEQEAPPSPRRPAPRWPVAADSAWPHGGPAEDELPQRWDSEDEPEAEPPKVRLKFPDEF